MGRSVAAVTFKCVPFIYALLLFLGLSSFYSELMKGIGASSRLWKLIDRNPTIPLSGVKRLELNIKESEACPLPTLRVDLKHN